MLLGMNSGRTIKSQVANAAPIRPIVQERAKREFQNALAVATLDSIVSATGANASDFRDEGRDPHTRYLNLSLNCS
jgi:hypothetical protein